MNYAKGDIIDGYKVLLPMKQNGNICTCRVRGDNGRLYVLKSGATEAEKEMAEILPTFVAAGDDYILYMHISGETLDARMKRQGKFSIAEATYCIQSLLTRLSAVHEKGYVHGNITADNILIDMRFQTEDIYLTGFSNVHKGSPGEDLQNVGKLMYSLVWGEISEQGPKVMGTEAGSPESNYQDIALNAIDGGFITCKEMMDCLSGKSAVKRHKKPTGPGFSAVAGMEKLKKQLREDVIDILNDSEAARQYGINIPNGMLLYGPPGCGKTFIAERFAEEAGYNYKYIKSSDLASVYHHGTQQKIGSLFDEARKNAPTILCLDEFDALVPNRDSALSAYSANEVNEFLSQLNNCGKDGVFVIASTNRPDMIDPAVLRTGRIDYIVYVPIPDAETREEIFRISLKERPAAENIDCAALAAKTQNYLASDISAIVQEAAREAFRKKEPITMELLLKATANRKPSLTDSVIRSYEDLRQRMESSGPDQSRRRIGF